MSECSTTTTTTTAATECVADEPVQSSAAVLYVALDKKIEGLYSFRDTYYIQQQGEKSSEERNRDLTAQLDEVLAEIEANRERLESKASYLVLVGKACNVMAEFSQKACDSLKKATKLDGKCVAAWNCLGECYWKKRDLEMCRICFEQSLSVSRQNKQGLRGMSMVIRQLINKPGPPVSGGSEQTSSQRCEHIKRSLEESIAYAKEALQLDVKDGMSWYILANCYVSKFFSPFGMQSSALLKQANSAYSQALKDKQVASLQSDLYFNKSMVSMYGENWLDTLNCLAEAVRLDPHWTEAADNLAGTLEYLTQLHEMCALKGKLKDKKFQAIVDTIGKAADLGPYAEYVKTRPTTAGSVAGAAAHSCKPNELYEADLSQLHSGLNKNRILVAKVICGLPTKTADNLVCFTAVLSDAKGDCAALTIYNLAAGAGVIIGNSVCIPEPWLETQSLEFEHEDAKGERQRKHQFNFKSVRVENPMVLVVNGKKWTKDKVSSAFFVPKVMSD